METAVNGVVTVAMGRLLLHGLVVVVVDVWVVLKEARV